MIGLISLALLVRWLTAVHLENKAASARRIEFIKSIYELRAAE